MTVKKYPQWNKLGMQDGFGKAKYYATLLREYGVSKNWIRSSLNKVGYGHINLDFLGE